LYHDWKGRPSQIGDVNRLLTSGWIIPIGNDGGGPFNGGGNGLLGGGPLGGGGSILLKGGNSGHLGD